MQGIIYSTFPRLLIQMLKKQLHAHSITVQVTAEAGHSRKWHAASMVNSPNLANVESDFLTTFYIPGVLCFP